jgi:two-component system response regulator
VNSPGSQAAAKLPKSWLLVAEDNPDDQLLLQCAFSKAHLDAELRFVSDGQQVLDYLQNLPPFENLEVNQRPSLILLDLLMPRLDGFEVLEWLKLQPALANIAVVVFSGTEQRAAMTRARALGARHYLIKPQSLEHLVLMARSLGTFLKVLEKSAQATVSC